MAKFPVAFSITNGNEGGWQNDPNDSGNASNGLGTYRGVASAKHSEWAGWATVGAVIAALPPQPAYGSMAYRAWVHGLNSQLAVDDGLQSMVQSFFQSGFWDINRLSELNSQAVANKVYDCGVNCGEATAAILLQRCLGVKVDGQVGPVTLAAANKMDGDTLAAAFRAARIARNEAIVAAHPNDAQYLTEWNARS